MTNPIHIRPVQPADNAVMAAIIRGCFEEFDAPRTGSVYDDPVTDRLFETFAATPRSGYWVVETDGEILGGAGVFPSQGLVDDTCELVKIYLKAAARGRGAARLLLIRCIEQAAVYGFKKMYLESFPEFGRAVSLYEQLGFKHIPQPLGQTGHTSCTIWMLLEL